MKSKKKATSTAEDAAHLSREDAAGLYAERRKRRSRSKGLKILAIVVVCVVALGAVGAWAYLSNIEGRLNSGVDQKLRGTLTTAEAGDPFYMLLLGVDKSEERAGSAEYGQDSSNYRTDSIMLARIDPKEKQVTLVSLHRDTLVDLGEHGQQKINAAYSLGGPSYTVQVVSQFADVPISHYAEIDFDHFEGIVNALGGIEVDVPIDIDDPYAGEPIKKGLQTLDGAQALTLCRSRHAYDAYGDGDLYRAANQRMVIAAIVKKVLASDPATMTATISSMADAVSTDLSLSDILSLANQMKGIDMDKDVYTGMEPTTSSYVNNTWYEICDTEAWKTMMTRVNQGLSPYASADEDPTGTDAGGTVNVKNDGGTDAALPDSTTFDTDTAADKDGTDYSGTVEVLNGAGEEGLAGRVANSLARYGYDTSAGTARNRYDDTVVVYMNEAAKPKAETVAKVLGGQVRVIDASAGYTSDADVLVVLGTDLRNYS